MKKLGLIIMMAILMTASIFAQKEQTLFKDSGLHVTGGWGGFTTGYLHFPKDYGVMTGGYGGIELNNNYFVGWSGERLKSAVDLHVEMDTFSVSNFNHNGFLFEYMAKANKVFHPKLGLVAGGGSFDYMNKAVAGNNPTLSKFIILQPAAGIEVNVLRWLHIGFDVGYKAIFIRKSDLQQDGYPFGDNNLSRPYAALKVKFGWSWK